MIAVIGLGFVGLTTALGFCEKSEFTVKGYDSDSLKSAMIKGGKVPFFEPYLPEALGKYLNNKFFVCNSLAEAVEQASIVILCVGTPCNEEGTADLSCLTAAIQDILSCKTTGGKFTLVIKSTVPPGTVSGDIADFCKSKGFNPGENILICNNPEFLREGHSWKDFVYGDRIVIGELTENSGEMLCRAYSGFNIPIYRVNANTAEFIKYLSNTLLATMISFSNEMSVIADRIGEVNVKDAFNILHKDSRWISAADKPANMATYVYPGCGFGGYCLPKDTLALYSRAKEFGHNSELLQSVLDINRDIKKVTAEKIIKSAVNGKVGILGLSFKPDSDDVRFSPAADIIKYILDANIEVFAYDPMANDNFKQSYNLKITYKENARDILAECDTIAILTMWKEFKDFDYSNKILLDCRYTNSI